MKSVMVSFSLLVTLALGQTPPYASLGTAPLLLPQFRPKASADLGNRVNLDGAASETDVAVEIPQLPEHLQGTLNDDVTVQRVAQWPAERRPFWFTNRDVLRDQREREVFGPRIEVTPLPWFSRPQITSRIPQGFEEMRERLVSRQPPRFMALFGEDLDNRARRNLGPRMDLNQLFGLRARSNV